jgi:hypothetical protein
MQHIWQAHQAALPSDGGRLQHASTRRATVKQTLNRRAEVAREAEIQQRWVRVSASLPLEEWPRLRVTALSSAPSVVLSLHAILGVGYWCVSQPPLKGIRFKLLDISERLPSGSVFRVAEVAQAVPSKLYSHRSLQC